MNSCFSELIGINGLCDNIGYELYLDDIGISLKSASKIADSKFNTGSNLIKRKINQAWKETFKDLSIDGFQFKKIACEETFIGNTNTIQDFNGVGEIKIVKTKKLLTSIQFKSVKFDGDGAYKLTITDGDDTFIYEGEEKSINVPIKFFGTTIEIEIDYESANVSSLGNDCCCPCSSSNCNFSIVAKKDYGLSFVVQEICDYESYLCRYSEMIAEAVIWKAGALILTEIIDSDRINDFTIAKEKNDLWTKIAYMDSSLNLFQYNGQVIQSSTSTIEVKPGRYQVELGRIKKQIPNPKDPYCITCNSSFYSISLP